MTFSTELFFWFAFVVPGQVFAILSLRRALFIQCAVRVKSASAELLADTQHVVSTSVLLALGWLVFLAVGLVALLSPVPVVTRVVEPTNILIVWGLLAAAGVWSLKTVADYLYTRRVWNRTKETLHANTR